MTSVFSWQNSISLCLASFHTPRPNLAVTPGVSWLPTFAFQSSVMKRTSFGGVSKEMLKIFQACLQQYVNRELPDGQAGFRKGWGTRNQIANICWIIKKAREFQQNICFCFIDYAKAFECVDHNKLWKILKEMGIPDHLTCLLRNLYAGQEATVRTEHGTADCFQIGKGILQGCILSLCLFNLYAEYIWEMLDWKKHKLESRLPREISITSDMQMTPPLRQRVKRN